MNNIDRFLRIIYKDCNLKRLFRVYEDDENLDACFNLMDETFKTKLINAYQYTYPNNYNESALTCMYQFYLGKTKSEDCKGDKNENTILNNRAPSAIDWLAACVKEMLVNGEKEIKVKREHLLHWDGVLNKIDSNILISLMCVLKQPYKEDTVYDQKSTVLNCADEKLSICLGKISENHMHLKGSGYTTEMSMQAVLHTPISYVDRLAENIKELHYDEKILGSTVDEVTENIRKLKLVRLFIFDMFTETFIFDKTERQNLLKSKSLYINKTVAHKISIIETKLSNLHKKQCDSHSISIKRYFILSRLYFEQAFLKYFENKDDDKNKAEYNYLLNMYISGISKLRFIFAQDNTGMSFERFKRYEDRKNILIGNIQIKDYDIYDSVFDKYIQEGNIEKVEFRIAPQIKSKQYHKLIKNLKSVATKHFDNKDEIFKYGIIIHFIKKQNAANYAPEVFYHRYEKYLLSQQKYYYTILSMLENEANETTDKIVGIDTANYEVNCPPEVFAGIFAQITEYALKTSKKKIYKTYHVGEDFRSIVTGMRRIDEAIDFLGLEKGDRLGHALAAGLDVKNYFIANRFVLCCSLEEWVDDLAWLYNIIKNSGYLDDYETKMYLTLLSNLFATSVEKMLEGVTTKSAEENDLVIDIVEYYLQMQKRGKWIEAKNKLLPQSDIKGKWLNMYFRDVQFYKNGQESIVQTVNDHIIKCAEIAQKYLVQKIISKGIIIEANPSSNRKISHINDNEDLPIIQFINKFALRAAWENICINTDDSAIFQTNLHNEYMIVYDYYKNESGSDIVKKMAENSTNQSFVK